VEVVQNEGVLSTVHGVGLDDLLEQANVDNPCSCSRSDC